MPPAAPAAPAMPAMPAMPAVEPVPQPAPEGYASAQPVAPVAPVAPATPVAPVASAAPAVDGASALKAEKEWVCAWAVRRSQQEQALNELQQALQESAEQERVALERMREESAPKVQDLIATPTGEALFRKTMDTLVARGYDEGTARNQAFTLLFNKMTTKKENAIKEERRKRDEEIRARMENLQTTIDGIDAQLRELGAL